MSISRCHFRGGQKGILGGIHWDRVSLSISIGIYLLIYFYTFVYIRLPQRHFSKVTACRRKTYKYCDTPKRTLGGMVHQCKIFGVWVCNVPICGLQIIIADNLNSVTWQVFPVLGRTEFPHRASLILMSKRNNAFSLISTKYVWHGLSQMPHKMCTLLIIIVWTCRAPPKTAQ